MGRNKKFGAKPKKVHFNNGDTTSCGKLMMPEVLLSTDNVYEVTCYTCLNRMGLSTKGFDAPNPRKPFFKRVKKTVKDEGEKPDGHTIGEYERSEESRRRLEEIIEETRRKELVVGNTWTPGKSRRVGLSKPLRSSISSRGIFATCLDLRTGERREIQLNENEIVRFKDE